MTSSTTATSGTSIQFTGLASGLDTSSIISSLMEVESAPQTALKTRVATEQSQVAELQTINSTLAGLGTAAKSFLTGSTWTQLAATSSNSAISVTASSSAVPANVSVKVDQVAAGAKAVVSTAFAANTTLTLYGADGTTPLTYKDATGTSVPITINTGTGSLSDVAAAINATTTNSGLRATIINASSGPVMEIGSTKTGAASDFSIGSGAGAVTGTGGSDAIVEVNGQTIQQSSNTLTSIMPGVDVTLNGTATAGTTTTISITDDGSSRANAMSQFVQSINGLLSTLSSDTAYGSITAGSAASGAGILAGNADLRGIATSLLNTLFAPGDTVSLNSMGLSVDASTGLLTFDSGTFESAYQADPAGVQAAFTGDGGFISRVQKVATTASDPYTGTLTQTITSMNDQIGDENDQISAWDDRLAQKQASLEQIYTNLETTLSTLQSQQSWLSSELDSLDSGWSQNNS